MISKLVIYRIILLYSIHFKIWYDIFAIYQYSSIFKTCTKTYFSYINKNLIQKKGNGIVVAARGKLKSISTYFFLFLSCYWVSNLELLFFFVAILKFYFFWNNFNLTWLILADTDIIGPISYWTTQNPICTSQYVSVSANI